MRQIVAIHGGHSGFESYEAFIAYLRDKVLDLSKSSHVGWKKNLQQALGEGYEVLLPSMPNKENARYLEWKIWFEKYIPHLSDGVVLIGHSLGGIFLAKYLGEEAFPKKIAATFLVAAPYSLGRRPHVEFLPPDSLAEFAAQSKKIFLFHSEDDPIVNFEELKKYRERLPHAAVYLFKNRGHFNEEELPEIVEAIKGL